MEKEYLTFAQAVTEFEPYEVVNSGLTWIDPKKIVALSIPVNQIIYDEKMERLKSLVCINGNGNYTYVRAVIIGLIFQIFLISH